MADHIKTIVQEGQSGSSYIFGFYSDSVINELCEREDWIVASVYVFEPGEPVGGMHRFQRIVTLIKPNRTITP